MSISDYLLDSVLVLLVLRQIRMARFDRTSVILPLAIVAVVAHTYLHTIPVGVTDLALIGAVTAVGLVFGVISAVTTTVRTDGGRYALVQAGPVAAGVWIFSMSARFAFAIWATHGGGVHLYHFSVQHGLDVRAWTAAIVLMALGEVVTRTGMLFMRTQRALIQDRAQGNALINETAAVSV